MKLAMKWQMSNAHQRHSIAKSLLPSNIDCYKSFHNHWKEKSSLQDRFAIYEIGASKASNKLQHEWKSIPTSCNEITSHFCWESINYNQFLVGLKAVIGFVSKKLSYGVKLPWKCWVFLPTMPFPLKSENITWAHLVLEARL